MDDSGKDQIAFTIGHSTRPVEEFISMLSGHHITRLLDVRTVPRSRTNPQFNREILPSSLSAAGIAYTHVPELGGLRKPKPDSPNGGWQNLSFRGFADHMQTLTFARGLELILQCIQLGRCALMCAEAVPWRCHRSLIADALTVKGVAVHEIVSPTKLKLHQLNPLAVVHDHSLTYPPRE